MQIKHIWIGLFVSLSVIGCGSKEDGGDAPEAAASNVFSQAQRTMADVEIGSLQTRLMSPVISCTGEIEVPPQGMASVTAPLGGYIAATEMVPGRYVRKGQLLATLTNPEYIVLQQSYLEVSGQLKFAEQDFLRQKTLQEQNATAAKKFQESESAFTVLKARLAGLKAQLNMIGVNLRNLEEGNIQEVVVLRAPINGYVTEVNHHPGEFVEPRESIFELVNMNDLHLHLNVFEQDVSRVHKDQIIRFRPTGGSGHFEGKVSLVSPKRSLEARSFDVHGHIETGEDRLKPGMYVEAEILTASDSLPALPEAALVYFDNKAFVVLAADNTYVLEEVEAGVKMDGWVEIRNARAIEGKQVVVKGASRISAALRRGE